MIDDCGNMPDQFVQEFVVRRDYRMHMISECRV
jgi:hypothetical protein